MTAEIVEPTYGEVKDSIARAKSSLEDAAKEIVWQIETRAWLVLGYDDWDAMRLAEYGGAAFMVPTAQRPELVARMRGAGLTQQQIADTAGVSQQQISNDLRTLNTNSGNDTSPATITNTRGQERPATYTRTPTTEDQYAAAVAEFPDLTYYTETGEEKRAVLIASDLRRYRELGELDERLDTLRRSIEVDRAQRNGTYEPAIPTSRTCPTCHGTGTIKEYS